MSSIRCYLHDCKFNFDSVLGVSRRKTNLSFPLHNHHICLKSCSFEPCHEPTSKIHLFEESLNAKESLIKALSWIGNHVRW